MAHHFTFTSASAQLKDSHYFNPPLNINNNLNSDLILKYVIDM